MDANTMQSVVQELERRGVPVTLEYPGFINFQDRLHFGDGADTLAYDMLGTEPGEIIGGEDSTIPRDSSDVPVIVDWIACTIMEYVKNSAPSGPGPDLRPCLRCGKPCEYTGGLTPYCDTRCEDPEHPYAPKYSDAACAREESGHV